MFKVWLLWSDELSPVQRELLSVRLTEESAIAEARERAVPCYIESYDVQ